MTAIATKNHSDQALLRCLRDNAADLPTPAYVYVRRLLDAAWERYARLLPPAGRCFYSLKANPQPVLVAHLHSLGAAAEVTGPGEMHLALRAGVPRSDVLVGGVSKSSAFLGDLCRAVEAPAAIVLDAEFEWMRLREHLPSAFPVPILLRINPGVSFGGIDMAGGSQFGMDLPTALSVARQCRSHPHVRFLGIHVYCGSQRLTVAPILRMLRSAEALLREFQDHGIDVATVVLGLGCGIPYLAREQDLDFDALRCELADCWRGDLWRRRQVWHEVGRALVAECGYYVCRVTGTKRLSGRLFVHVDGGIHVHNPGLGLGRFFHQDPRVLFVAGASRQAPQETTIVGPLCTPFDCLLRSQPCPPLREGDFVVVPNAGAYCLTSAMWGFNTQPLCREMLLDDDAAPVCLESRFPWTPPDGSRLSPNPGAT